MSDISFFIDEDVHGELAGILRASGFDAVSTPEAGRLRDPIRLTLNGARKRAEPL